LASFLIALCLSFTLLKSNYEHAVVGQARAASQSFRNQILEGSARFVEDQIKLLYSLSENESVYLLDKDGTRIYRPQEAQPIVPCPSRMACWNWKTLTVSTKAPVAFDEDGKNIYGYVYLERQMKPSFSQFIVITLSIFFGVALLIFGVRSAASRLSEHLAQTVSSWAEQIKTNPKEIAQLSSQVPIRELEPMYGALLGLNRQISEFESKAEYNAKLRLVRSVAHDLATPISQMDKYLFVLRDQLEAGHINMELVEDVEHSLERLRRLSSQTKDLNRIENASKVSKLDLIREVSLVMEDLRDSFSAEKKKVLLSSDFGGLKSALINADPLQVDRLVSNLVKNAFQASRSDSEIKVSIRTAGSQFLLSVEDSGHGIAQENLERIFEPDFTTRPATGTGLGLSIVKEICDALGADVSVHSVKGQGTVFTIKFQNELKGGLHEPQNSVGR
jgi:signal transduction histidine kinase